MKNIIKKSTIFLFTLLLFNISSYSQEGEVLNGPQISVDKEIHDYGTVEQFSDGNCTFTITNTGNAPLIISNCRGTCGCTTPDCPNDPIMPGQSRTITVHYDTKRVGPFNKNVLITSNATNTNGTPFEIKIKGDVKMKPEKPNTSNN